MWDSQVRNKLFEVCSLHSNPSTHHNNYYNNYTVDLWIFTNYNKVANQGHDAATSNPICQPRSPIRHLVFPPGVKTVGILLYTYISDWHSPTPSFKILPMTPYPIRIPRNKPMRKGKKSPAPPCLPLRQPVHRDTHNPHPHPRPVTQISPAASCNHWLTMYCVYINQYWDIRTPTDTPWLSSWPQEQQRKTAHPGKPAHRVFPRNPTTNQRLKEPVDERERESGDRPLHWTLAQNRKKRARKEADAPGIRLGSASI